ncbi:MCR_0457 family protein [Aquirhabdus sp.]|uniref:MCR_0457 family protein n=1 Tax=Aquirhabdus sp. TaxID=2824160 RepID=UPI00396CEF4A
MNRIHLATNTLVAALLSTCFIATSSFAADSSSKATVAKTATSKSTAAKTAAKSQVEVEGGSGASQEEIATIDVLNEICPQILGTNNNKNFHKGYTNLLTELLPSIQDPVLAVASMHTDPDYMKILASARTRTLAEKTEDNRDVCLDVLHYPAPKHKAASGDSAAQ